MDIQAVVSGDRQVKRTNVLFPVAYKHWPLAYLGHCLLLKRDGVSGF